MEVLSEHQCQGWLEGYLLTGRHGLFTSYEAFIHIVASMVNQHLKWLKVTDELHWRRPIASLNYLLSSHVWRQDHNGFSHQDPGFIDHVVNKGADIVRVYLPPDTNTLLATYDHVLRTRQYVNVVVAGKQPGGVGRLLFAGAWGVVVNGHGFLLLQLRTRRAMASEASLSLASCWSSPACAASSRQWAMCSSSSTNATLCSAREAAETWVRMSMQYLSSSTILAMPRTWPSIRRSRMSRARVCWSVVIRIASRGSPWAHRVVAVRPRAVWVREPPRWRIGPGLRGMSARSGWSRSGRSGPRARRCQRPMPGRCSSRTRGR